jgi:hypothetical protein
LEHSTPASQLVAELDEVKVQYLNELSGVFTKHNALLQDSSLKHKCGLDHLHTVHQCEVWQQQLMQEVTNLQSHHDFIVSHHTALLDKMITDVKEEHEQEKGSPLTGHIAALSTLRANDQVTIAWLHASLVTTEQEHWQGLAAFREEHDAVFTQECECHLTCLWK